MQSASHLSLRWATALFSCAQADAASGKLQLKDSGARLQEGISETAARLAHVLSTLAQHGAAEPPWPAQCFQSTSLRFIDADGQVQVSELTSDAVCLHVSTSMQPPSLAKVRRSQPCCLTARCSKAAHHSEAYRVTGLGGASGAVFSK